MLYNTIPEESHQKFCTQFSFQLYTHSLQMLLWDILTCVISRRRATKKNAQEILNVIQPGCDVKALPSL